MTKLTEPQRGRAIRNLYNRLLEAIEATDRGINNIEITETIDKVCHDCDIKIWEVKTKVKLIKVTGINPFNLYRPLVPTTIVQTPEGKVAEVINLSNNDAELATVLFEDGTTAHYHYDDLGILA